MTVRPAVSARLRRRQRSAALGCLLAFVPFAGGATTEYAVEVGKGVEGVDNPFLFPRGSPDPFNRSDTIHTTNVGAAIRMPLPSDRSFLAISGAASRQDYQAIDSLDHTQKQFDALYQWEFGQWLRGRLRHRFDQRLYNYYAGRFTQLETPRNQEDLVEVALRITPQLDLPVTYSEKSLRYDDAGLAQRYDSQDRGLRLALTYTSGTKSVLSVGVRQTEVNFPQRSAEQIAAIDSGFTDREAFAEVAWRYTENTIVIGRIGRLDRRFASLANRNTQLIATELGADWRYSAKTQFSLRGFNRPQSNDQADLRLYVVSSGISARGIWDATAKTRFSLTGSYELQKYQSFEDVNGIGATGRDRVSRLTALMEYAATPQLLLRLEGSREYFRPDPAFSNGTGFARNAVRLGMNYTFENMTGRNRARQQLDQLRYERIR